MEEHKSQKNRNVCSSYITQIAKILKDYSDGTQIARELLQNSDDAGSKVQWFLLDYHDFSSEPDSENLKLYNSDTKEFLGPALLAGNDTMFRDQDFTSMENLANSVKVEDNTKIGQMGIGFNSVYHMTDLPSFISGDQFMMIDPHQWIFKMNGNCRQLTFTEEQEMDGFFHDQLRTYNVLKEKIDFTKPYKGTIFRFPLRTKLGTEAGPRKSLISSDEYTTEMVQAMFDDLKKEALKSMLFLVNIEKIIIYERRSEADGPKKLFEIEITNSDEVFKSRQFFWSQYPGHLKIRNSELQYSITPKFKLTQHDGEETFEEWRISTLVGDHQESLEYLSEETGRDIEKLRDQKLIPWVGVASPSKQNVKITDTGKSGLFCFLPMSITIPFPVHINARFAIKSSRSEIWTDQDNNIRKSSEHLVSCRWNVYLVKTHIPKIYARFLEQMGTTRGLTYDLWPGSSEGETGDQSLWKYLLPDVLETILKDNLQVFFCEKGNKVTSYMYAYFTGKDVEGNPVLLRALKGIDILVTGLPDAILNAIPKVATSLGYQNRILSVAVMRRMLREYKDSWSGSTTAEEKIELLKFCIKDGGIADLEGLPLLPLASGEWVNFESRKSRERFLAPKHYLVLLERSKQGLIDVTVDGGFFELLRENRNFDRYWSTPTADMMVSKIKDISIKCPNYQDGGWIEKFWDIIYNDEFHLNILGRLETLSLLPLKSGYEPLVKGVLFPFFKRQSDQNGELRQFFDIFYEQLGGDVLRDISCGTWDKLAPNFTFNIDDVAKTIQKLSESNVTDEKLESLSQSHREIVFKYISSRLNFSLNARDILRKLPIYPTYNTSGTPHYVSVRDADLWRIARGYSPDDYPWLPKSVMLLDGRHLVNPYLTWSADIMEYSESQYWCDILKHLEKYPVDQWDKIFLCFSTRYAHLKKQQMVDNFQSILINVPFVPVTTRSNQGDLSSVLRLSPREVVDPSISHFYHDNERVFPAGEYAESSVLSTLIGIGICSILNVNWLLDRIKVLAKHANDGNVNGILRPMEKIYSLTDSNVPPIKAAGLPLDFLKNLTWILAKNSTGEIQCYAPDKCRPKDDAELVGSQMPIATFSFGCPEFKSLIEWNGLPPLDKVLAHFHSLISADTNRLTVGLSIKFYDYFKKYMTNTDSLELMKKSLQSTPWILVNDKLYTTEKVTINSSLRLEPHFARCNSSEFGDLFLAMGCRKNIDQADLQILISEIGQKYKNVQLPGDEVELVVEMLKGVSNERGYQRNPNLFVLAENHTMHRLDQVVFDDTNARINLREIVYFDRKYIFVNDKISREIALKLGVTMFSAKYLEELKDSDFEGWPQEISVMDRLSTFMEDSTPSDIFTEFLQNAEDAGASKFKLIFDKRSFRTDKLLGPKMAAWQGPALMIYNNAEFTERDFEGICNIDKGSKKGDSTKIGRHGLGFNTVYHFTDMPSVVSRSHIGFFDPQRVYLPPIRTSNGEIPQGGLKCNFTKQSGGAYINQWKPYKDNFNCDMKSAFDGTIFRIPLRTYTINTLGAYKGKTWEISAIEKLIYDFATEAQHAMLFLEKIETIEISIISDNQNDKSSFSWEFKKSFVSLEETPTNGTRRQLEIDNGAGINLSESILSFKKIENDVAADVSEILAEDQKKQDGFKDQVVEIKSPYGTFQWMVVTNSNIPVDAPEEIISLGKKNRWHPHSGVAIPLNNFNAVKIMGKIEGRIFNHLPTPITTKLPFHIHGEFSLISNRKNIADNNILGNLAWNTYLMENCLPEVVKRAFINILEMRLRNVKNDAETRGVIEDYFGYWPTDPSEYTAKFVRSLFKLFHSSPVFPIEGPPTRILKGCDVDFLSLGGREIPEGIEDNIHRYLKDKRNISLCPTQIQARLFSAWKSKESLLKHTEVNPQYILRVISEDKNFIPSCFTDFNHKRWIVNYALGELLKQKDYTEEYLSCLNLVPLMDGTWRSLSKFNTCHMAKSEMTQLLSNKTEFLDTSIFYGTAASLIFNREILNDLLARKIGVTEITVAKFTELFNSENPNGPSNDKRQQLYAMLQDYNDLGPFLDLLILRGTDGNIYPLKKFKDIDISRAIEPSIRDFIMSLAGILRYYGYVIYDGSENLIHPYIRDNTPAIDHGFILSRIQSSKAVANLSVNMTKEIARTIRSLIEKGSSGHSDLAAFGDLEIWPSYTSDTRIRQDRLIKAKGSMFIDGNYSLNNLGDYPNIIHGYNNPVLESLGAIPIDIFKAVDSEVTPRFLNGSLLWLGDSKNAYIEIFSSFCIKFYEKNFPHVVATVPKDLQIPTRNNTFRACNELFSPNESLVESIFGEDPSLFPDEALWSRLSIPIRIMLPIKSLAQLSTVVECAKRVESLIHEAADSVNPIVLQKSETLVRFIYNVYGSISQYDWMTMKIVPAKSLQSIFNEKPPCSSKYLSFEELVDPQYYDVCWTQSAFFREDLKPRGAIINHHPGIGIPKVSTVVDHLIALVTDIAKLANSRGRMNRFQDSLLATYEWLNNYVKNGNASNETTLCNELQRKGKYYIWNGDDPRKATSWKRPNELVFDLDDVEYDNGVFESIQKYREFLVIAGVQSIEKSEHRVAKPKLRKPGDLETILFDSYKAQDREGGYMDVIFRFGNESIMAHKLILKCFNDRFATWFNGKWSISTVRDVDCPLMDVIVMDNEIATFEVFAGLLYFIYTGRLIKEDEQIPGVKGQISIRHLEYLLQLLRAAHYYYDNDDTALKDLIAIEILENHMKIAIEFITINHIANIYGPKAFQKSCEDHLINNKTYFVENKTYCVEKYRQSIEEDRRKLESLSEGNIDEEANLEEGNIDEKEDLEEGIKALESELEDFFKLADN